MAIRIKERYETKWGRREYHSWGVFGVSKEFAAYERKIITGKIPCPFKVQFIAPDKEVLSNAPIPLTPDGEPKVSPFN